MRPARVCCGKRAAASLLAGTCSRSSSSRTKIEVSPPFPAMFSFMMLGSTPRGDAYTEREFEQMGRAAGFQEVSFASLPPTPQTVVKFA